MNVYCWEHEYKTNAGTTEIVLHTVVVEHIVSLYVARSGYGDDAMPFALNIQTKERCWERRFDTFENAKAQYEYIGLLLGLRR